MSSSSEEDAPSPQVRVRAKPLAAGGACGTADALAELRDIAQRLLPPFSH
jgi:hypothetical protein